MPIAEPEVEWLIRPMRASDRDSLFHICVMTGDAGQSAELHHRTPKLQGLIYAEPYLVIPSCFGFVLVCPDPDSGEKIVGCIVGTPDSHRFEAATEKGWYPPLRLKYPKSPYPSKATEADRQLIDLIHKPETTPQEVLRVSQAHIHIDLLPKAQRQGWGRKLMGEAVDHLRELGHDSLFVGIDPRNNNGRSFYLAVGFESVPTPEGEYYRLDFNHWKKPGSCD